MKATGSCYASPVNKAWHARNKMPNNPTLQQRIAWHKRHHRACACREIPKSLLEYREEEVRDQGTAKQAAPP
jgi:hypothetical protein